MNTLHVKKGDNVMIISGKDKGKTVCPKCNKATRVGHKIEGDKKVRVCKHCGANL